MVQNSFYRSRATPLSRHPAFVPLVTLWFAALLGGSVAVMPAGRATGLMHGFGLTLPPSAINSEVMIAVAAMLIGGLVGFAAARIAASLQSFKPAETAMLSEAPAVRARSLAGAGSESPRLSDAEAAPPEPEVPPFAEPPTRHGKAVRLLRSHDTADLAMPQLIERFAVALDDHRRRGEGAAHTYTGLRPSADLATRLRKLNPA